MNRIEVTTQAEFDKHAGPGVTLIVRAGFFVARGNSSVVARENSSVVAWENSSVVARENSSVEAWGNSSVEAWENSSVVAWENSSVVAWENSSVEAWGNSSVEARGNSSVEAWENSSVEAWGNSSVEARGNSSVEARGNSSVEAWGNVFIRLFSALKIKASASVMIMKHGKAKSIKGGVQIKAFIPKTPKQWCEFWDVKVSRGLAYLFKAVDDDYHSPYGADYSPGQQPEAPDWDGGEVECGYGLHFSPSPKMAREFNGNASKYVLCKVSLKDMAIHPEGNYPQKCKAKGVSRPCIEVDINGEEI